MTSQGEYQHHWPSAQPSHSAQYLFPEVEALLEGRGRRLLDVGCGNGHMAGALARQGYDVVGVDMSREGIDMARRTYPGVRFEVMVADAGLLENLGTGPFDVIVSTEVIEHLYDPKSFARGCFQSLRPGGRLILSTPYHGWLKNIALAATGGFDRHVQAQRHGGHIKFFSRQTLGSLLADSGFVDVRFRGAGRLPRLWKSMVMSGDRPAR